MEKHVKRHILSVIIMFLIIALLPSEFTMIVGSAIFATATFGLPFRAIVGGAVICTWIFSLTSADFGTGILLSLSFVIPGWIEGILLKRRRSLSTVISFTAIARSGLLLLCYDRMASLEGVTIKDFVFGDIPISFLDELKAAGETEETIKLLADIWNVLGNMLPSMIMIVGLSFAFLSLALTKYLIGQNGYTFLGMRKFSDIRMDISFTLCAIIICVFAFVETEMQNVLVNSFYVICVIYATAGFAFVYRLIKKGVNIPIAAFLLTALTGLISCGIIFPVMGIIGSFVRTDFDKETPSKMGGENNEIAENRKED